MITEQHRILANLCLRAKQSPDPSTQNAAGLVDPLSWALDCTSVNRFPRGIKDTNAKWERPGKYDRVIHAETGALMQAARLGIPTAGMWMFACWAACGPCASLMVEAGITRLVTLASSDPDREGVTHERWADSIRIGFETIREAGVEIVFVDHPVTEEGFFLLRNGEEFRP